LARALARKNIQAFSGSDGPIITSCASCSSHLLSYPNLFAETDPWHKRACALADRVQEFTAFFSNNLPSVLPAAEHRPERIFYHDPCHLRFTEQGMSAPRALLDRMKFCRVESEDGPHCCGQGGLFQLACPEHAERIFQESSSRALARQPDCITTTCSGCLMQYQEGIARQKLNIRVQHMAVLLADLLREQT
jgi:glycolate oxidase iron-sulfur subunit